MYDFFWGVFVSLMFARKMFRHYVNRDYKLNQFFPPQIDLSAKYSKGYRKKKKTEAEVNIISKF
jgi:hypothetical protein